MTVVPGVVPGARLGAAAVRPGRAALYTRDDSSCDAGAEVGSTLFEERWQKSLPDPPRLP